MTLSTALGQNVAGQIVTAIRRGQNVERTNSRMDIWSREENVARIDILVGPVFFNMNGLSIEVWAPNNSYGGSYWIQIMASYETFAQSKFAKQTFSRPPRPSDCLGLWK